ncbi:MAG TPA: HNH endonuclease domain-containing protein, partial [Ferruginibacter sp.]|nr:HNH endonuclease domain-containing protein [Ferruginibacter sp.]
RRQDDWIFKVCWSSCPFLSAQFRHNRHSDTDAREKYKEASELQINKLIPYNSLRNPVVEKIVRESLKLVKDIWLDERLGRPDYIHIELSRDLKKNNEEKQEISKTNYKNKLEKDRTIALLKELKYPTDSDPSGSDVEKFKIWLESGGYAGKASFEAIFKPNKAEWISHAHVEKYRLWAEQNYISPYSGKVIPLSQLFTEKYQVDHIIPRSRYYDDSTSNKVVVEAQLNELKGNQLAIQFIENSQGQGYDVLNLTDFVSLVDKTYSNKKKRQYLKLYEVPEGFIQRQLNDTKYISRTIGKMLRPIALGTETDDGIVYTSGTITNDLKGKWGLHNLWKEILKPRFERLEGILGEPLIVGDTENPGKFRFAKDIKRIDHRHHALDALTIACTSRSHIKYLNSLNSFSNNKKDIIKYNEWAKWKYLLNKKKQLENLENGMLEFNLPWDGFYEDAREALLSVIVSHKPTSRLISKTINKYYKYVEVSPGKWEKKIHLQQNPTDEDKYWVAVRQSLFGQPYGKIKIAEYKKNVALKQAIKLQVAFLQRSEKQWATEDWRIAQTVLRKKIDFIIRQHNFDEKSILKTLTTTPLLDEAGDKIEFIDLLQFKSYASKRVSLDESFTIDKVNKIPYANHPNNWLTRLISSHLAEYENDPKLAFKGEALELLHKKSKLPISKVTRTEAGNKREINNKLLDGDKGVNQFFIVEITKKLNKKTGELETVRQYKTPDFLDCIERLAKKLPIHDENPDSQYTVLSPGDMVYVPHENENISSIDWSDQKKLADSIYIMRSSQDTKCYFLPATVASLIMYYDAKTKKGEFGSLNNSEKTWNQSQAIKSNFIKLKVDRLGYVKPD